MKKENLETFVKTVVENVNKYQKLVENFDPSIYVREETKGYHVFKPGPGTIGELFADLYILMIVAKNNGCTEEDMTKLAKFERVLLSLHEIDNLDIWYAFNDLSIRQILSRYASDAIDYFKIFLIQK